MTTREAQSLSGGSIVRSGEYVGVVTVPKHPTGYFTVHWAHGTTTRHHIYTPHHISDLSCPDSSSTARRSP